MRHQGKEIEIKLAVSSVALARRRLRAAGFRLRERRSFESNAVFDTPERLLARQGFLLRLRTVGRRHWLTFKRPGGASKHFKVKEEFETELLDPAVPRQVFAALGLEPVFRYEKFRAVYTQRGGEAMLDETPIGTFIELEGSRSWIRRAARDLLGARPEQFITQNYASLYANWCRRHRRPVQHMIFSSRRRAFALKT
ncbi:MAG TPA: class IV adenylate cyclase [Candidatus Acidoferrales bacterium]|nr:class IV adenylate cyclase [Candidatus Acidoferrales bacterium]